MTRATNRPSAATRRTGGRQTTPNAYDPRGEQDLRDNQELVGDRDRDDGNERNDRTERDERDSYDEQSEQRARREQDACREDRADDRDERSERVERDSRDEQSDQRQRSGQELRREQGRAGHRDEWGSHDTRGEQWHGDHSELGDGREHRREPDGVQRTVEQLTDRARAATSNPGDAFAPTPDMSKVLTAWFDMAGDMMKLQQQFFSTVLGAENTNDRNTTKA